MKAYYNLHKNVLESEISLISMISMKENSEKVEKAKKKSSKFIAPNSRDLPYISQFQHEDWHLGKRALLISPEAILSKHDHAKHEAILSLHHHRLGGTFSSWHRFLNSHPGSRLLWSRRYQAFFRRCSV